MAVVPLALGFVGAVVVDQAFGERTSVTSSVAVAPGGTPAAAHPALSLTIGEPVIVAQPARPPAAALSAPSSSRTLAWGKAHVEQGRMVAPLGDSNAVLTREPALEDRIQRFLDDAKAPYAATVLMDPSTGRVLAVAESSTRGSAKGLAFQPMAKAASVFKVVTTSALLQAGVSPESKVCIHGGKTRMQPALLVDNGKRDTQCTTLGDALPRSQNVAIAKLALKHLDPARLRAEAQRWGFDQPLPLDVDVAGDDTSPASIPDDPFGFANAAAGFGDVKISAMHGAMLASIVANGGMMVPPQLVDDDAGQKPHRVVDEKTASVLARLMRETVATGTARKAFSSAPKMAVPAAGKTGSLADYDTGLETTWFIGYAPADHPEVVVATVVVNTAVWNVRAPVAAKEALRTYFAMHPAAKPVGLVARR